MQPDAHTSLAQHEHKGTFAAFKAALAMLYKALIVCNRYKSAAEQAARPKEFITYVKLLSGTNDRPGIIGIYRVDKNPSHVGACYSCEQKGITVATKTIYPC